MNRMVSLSFTLGFRNRPLSHWKRLFHSQSVAFVQSEAKISAMQSRLELASKSRSTSCAIAKWKLVDPSWKPCGGGSTLGSLAALSRLFTQPQGYVKSGFGIAPLKDSGCAHVSNASASISRAAIATGVDFEERGVQLLERGLNTEPADVSGDAVVLGRRKRRGSDGVQRQSSEAVQRQTLVLEDQKMGRGKQLGAPGATAKRGVRETHYGNGGANGVSHRIQGADQLQGQGGGDGGASGRGLTNPRDVKGVLSATKMELVTGLQANCARNACPASPSSSAEKSWGELEQLTTEAMADRRARSLDTASTSGRGPTSSSSGGDFSPQKEGAQGRVWDQPSRLMQPDISNGASESGRGAHTVVSSSGATDVVNAAAYASNGAANGSNGAAGVSRGPSGLTGVATFGGAIETQATSRGLSVAARPNVAEPHFDYLGNGVPNVATSPQNGAPTSKAVPPAGLVQPGQSWKFASDLIAPVETNLGGARLDKVPSNDGRLSSFQLNGADVSQSQRSSRVLAVRGKGGEIEHQVGDPPTGTGVIRSSPVASLGRVYPKSLFPKSLTRVVQRPGVESRGGVSRGKAELNAVRNDAVIGGEQLELSFQRELGAGVPSENTRLAPAGTQPANLSANPAPSSTQVDFPVPPSVSPLKPDSPSPDAVPAPGPHTLNQSINPVQNDSATVTDGGAPKARKIPEMKMRKAKPKTLNPRKSAKQTQTALAESAPSEPTNGRARSSNPSKEKTTLEAVVRRIVYENADNGYVIARVKAVGDVSGLDHLPGTQKQGRRGWGGKSKGGKEGEDLLTVVGTLPKIAEGQPLRLTGNWRDNAKFGREFVAAGCEEMEVSSLPDLVTYLGGGSLPKVRGRF